MAQVKHCPRGSPKAGKSRSRLWNGQVQAYATAAMIQEVTTTTAAPAPAHPQGQQLDSATLNLTSAATATAS